MPRRPVVVFDVNETLMNLGTLRPTFDQIFNDCSLGWLPGRAHPA
jgi:2-haloacid dehalogenase